MAQVSISHSVSPVTVGEFISILIRNGYLRLAVAKSGKADQPLISFKTFDLAWEFLRNQTEQYSLCKRLCNIQTVNGSCLDLANGNCLGACIQQEPSSQYNDRVRDCLTNFKYLDNSYLLLGKGRSHTETSLVWVENGKYKGFGFVEDAIQESELDGLIHSIQAYADNQDVQRIISTYLNGPSKIPPHHATPGETIGYIPIIW